MLSGPPPSFAAAMSRSQMPSSPPSLSASSRAMSSCGTTPDSPSEQMR